MAGTVCNFATQIKFFAGYDDSLDVFASHAVGGIVGNILTALFAQASVAKYDGFTIIAGGWLDHHWIQLAWHLADSAAGLGYSFVMTTIILWIMHYIPGLRLRVSEDTEELGIDEADMGEYAYDYVGLESETRPLVSLRATATAMNMDAHSENHYMKERGSQGSAGQRSYGL